MANNLEDISSGVEPMVNNLEDISSGVEPHDELNHLEICESEPCVEERCNFDSRQKLQNSEEQDDLSGYVPSDLDAESAEAHWCKRAGESNSDESFDVVGQLAKGRQSIAGGLQPLSSEDFKGIAAMVDTAYIRISSKEVRRGLSWFRWGTIKVLLLARPCKGNTCLSTARSSRPSEIVSRCCGRRSGQNRCAKLLRCGRLSCFHGLQTYLWFGSCLLYRRT